MRFMIDESAGMAVVKFLREAGHDVAAVVESLSQAQDQEILAAAASQRRILITNDKDFGELVFRSGQAHCGVILLRLHDERAGNRVAVVRAVLDQHADHLADRFTVASETGIRIRHSDLDR